MCGQKFWEKYKKKPGTGPGVTGWAINVHLLENGGKRFVPFQRQRALRLPNGKVLDLLTKLDQFVPGSKGLILKFQTAVHPHLPLLGNGTSL